jgi:murein DD-endopeptidase MepM/ murein hydrolase activator NlpD
MVDLLTRQAHRTDAIRLLVWLVILLPPLTACGRNVPPPSGVPASADRHLKPDTEEISGEVPQDATLAGLLRGYLQADRADAAVRVIANGFDPRKLRAHQRFTLTRTLDGWLRAFRYEINADTYLTVAPTSPLTPADLKVDVVTYARTQTLAVAAGTINKETPSLFESMDKAGESVDLSVELAAVFAGEIDFNSELQPGDHFRLAFEKITRENGTVSYGSILAAEFHNDGRQLNAFRFAAPDGKVGFYDETGRSLKRFFLKSPLKFEPRITSRFSYSRMHPVLNVRRAHLGVDYAAPVGASVVAVSPGTVTRAGFSGDAGRLVAVRHTSGYESLYLHLSSIAVRVGQRVSQGDIVGRVGSSGLSTGPHLDYRLRKNGVYVNPLVEHRRMPPGDPIPALLMAAYRAERDKGAALLLADLTPPPTGSAAGRAEPAAPVARGTPTPTRPGRQ